LIKEEKTHFYKGFIYDFLSYIFLTALIIFFRFRFFLYLVLIITTTKRKVDLAQFMMMALYGVCFGVTTMLLILLAKSDYDS
jgi:H+/Cl- antiporter ClcA